MQFQAVRWWKQTGRRHWNISYLNKDECRVPCWTGLTWTGLEYSNWPSRSLPSRFELIQYVGLTVGIWWAPVVVFMLLVVNALFQTQPLSVLAAELLNRSFGDLQPELSKNELASYLTCLQSTASSAFYKLFYKPIDRRGRVLTLNNS